MADPMCVFISYSSKDADLVDRLKRALAQAGVAVWLAHEQLTPGTRNWQIAVRTGIAKATHVVYAASETAALSEFVYDEINIARNKGKKVIPFWVRGADWHDCIPIGFGAIQLIDGRDAAYAGGLTELLDALGIVAQTTPSPAQAFEDSPDSYSLIKKHVMYTVECPECGTENEIDAWFERGGVCKKCHILISVEEGELPPDY